MTGLSGSASNFDGDDYISQPTLFDTTPSNIGVSFWFMLDSAFDNGAAANESFGGKSNVANDDRFWIYLENADGKLYFKTEENGNGDKDIASDRSYWAANTWYHIVVNWDTTNGMRMWVDSVLQTDVDATATTLMANGTNNDFYIGIHLDGASTPLNGKMDEVRIYDIAFSASDVQAIYERGNRNVTNPLASTTEWDYTKSANIQLVGHATLTAPSIWDQVYP